MASLEKEVNPMFKTFLAHTTSVRRRTLVVAMALTASLAALSVASPALAAPNPEYAVFADCPFSNAKVEGCIVAKTESGKIVAGKATVPIEKTITLQGGFEEEEAATFRMPFVGAADGNTLSKTPQNVPGGLLGMINCKAIKNAFLRKLCEAIVKSKLNAVTATTELAAPASAIFLSEAALNNPILSEAFGIPALALPVKVKLDNVFLGKACYIGSSTEPIVLKLITGKTKPPPPNKSITGKIGELSSRAEGGILVIKNNSLVDNSFAVPGANGCGGIFAPIVDAIINAKLGLPSAAGNNTAVLEGTLEQAGAELVKEELTK